jgi:hypothetical protein
MLATMAVKSQSLGANREINIGHYRTLADFLTSLELDRLANTSAFYQD